MTFKLQSLLLVLIFINLSTISCTTVDDLFRQYKADLSEYTQELKNDLEGPIKDALNQTAPKVQHAASAEIDNYLSKKKHDYEQEFLRKFNKQENRKTWLGFLFGDKAYMMRYYLGITDLRDYDALALKVKKALSQKIQNEKAHLLGDSMRGKITKSDLTYNYSGPDIFAMQEIDEWRNKLTEYNNLVELQNQLEKRSKLSLEELRTEDKRDWYLQEPGTHVRWRLLKNNRPLLEKMDTARESYFKFKYYLTHFKGFPI